MVTFRRAVQLIVLMACVFALNGCGRQKKAEVRKVKIGDVEIAYYTRGSGDPLLMIMGFRGTMAVWDPGLLDLLEKKYTLVLFDNRGAGLSSDTNEDRTTIPQMAEDTAALIKALGYQKTHVLGWSMGSRIAQVLAVNHPEMVDKLILCSPNPGGKYSAPRKNNSFQQLTSADISQADALSLIFPDTPEGKKGSRSFIVRLTEAIVNGSVPNDVNVSRQTIERQVHALKLWEENNQFYETLPDIKMPALVAGGLADIIDNPENVQTVARRIPFAWAAYFAGAGHDFLSQDYEQFAQLLEAFIEKGG